jgi:uncharacterized protein DUF3866
LLKLRRGTVVSVDPGPRVTSLRVKVESGGERQALAYPGLTGGVEVGDDVVVNVEAQDLGLGSGGFDIVCVNLTRGLVGEAESGAHVMKLNYTPLQHAVEPVEEGLETRPRALGLRVSVLALHGQLPPAAFAARARSGDARIGYLQTAGGALPGQLSDVVHDLLERELLAGHVTVAPCFGGAHEAITLEGALQAVEERLGWDRAFVGPGPGILGSASALGHGGLGALNAAHSALALGCDVALTPRLSSGDPRPRHRGLSHHTQAVLELLLRPVSVALPSGIDPETRAALERAIEAGGHSAVEVEVDELFDSYRQSGLPVTTMGRSLEQDADFFKTALAGGALLGR